MRERVLARDDLAGITQYFSYDPSSDEITIRTEQDDALHVAAHEVRKHTQASDRWKDNSKLGLHIAAIPPVVYYDLVRKGITRDQKAMTDWLNDPDNEVFRMRKGRI